MARKATWLALSCALLCAGTLWAQTASPENGESRGAAREQPDEVVVRGRRLADFRAELQAARVHVYDLFNDLNSDDAFDVHCQVEDSTGTRMRQHTCRPQFKGEISADAASAWVYALMDACGSELDQDCIFGNFAAASQAKSAALAEESREQGMQQRFALEMARVVRDHPEMQQAILDHQAVERAYDEARGARRRCDRPDPPARCSR